MAIRSKQSKFAHAVALLILYIEQKGYEVTFGDAYRDPRCKYGHKRTLHRKRLAIDLNLFKAGVYIRDDTGHREFHDYWVEIGGAAMVERDPNHYSFEHRGMR